MSEIISRKNIQKNIRVALLTGGPSLERGISLNSARSVLDHLGGDDIEIVPVYFDQKKRAYKISHDQLYSNTPSDFDFKLAKHSSPLDQKSLVKLLKGVDIVFPAMHGNFGEDGEIQAFLEKNNISFVGSGSKACKMAFDKYEAHKTITEKGFFTLPSALLKIYSKDNAKIVDEFFKKNNIKRAIVKPTTGGSSIGTFSVETPAEAIEKAELIFSKRMDTRVILEPFASGREFTVIVLENKFGLPVALMTTEIEMAYHEGRIFDFRKKYLPTNQVKYHYPARFDLDTIEKIQTKAEQIFKIFGMNDFARFDGWVMPNGEIWFSDFNTISGMEQNSFLFQQSSRIGMSHSDFLKFIVKNSCQRQGIAFPENKSQQAKNKKPVPVLFGGGNSERQVSLMSGTNVWLKLRKSKTYFPMPYMLDFEGNVWRLPYSFVLNHTVEEIFDNASKAGDDRKKIESLEKRAKIKLAIEESEVSEDFFMPEKISFHDFTKKYKFIFLGLHGGDGENGNMQKIFSNLNIKHNGSYEKTSRICMDKFQTGEFIRSANISGISIAPQKIVTLDEINATKDISVFWEKFKGDLEAKTIIAKPVSDGCSTGVVHLYTVEDFKKYFIFIATGAKFIPPETLTNQEKIIELPSEKVNEILFEKFIETDFVSVKNQKLKYKRVSGLIEVTIGLIEEKDKNKSRMHAFNPSITIAEGEVLTLEEKFQGGTGINITPPPKEIIKPKAVMRAKKLAQILATQMGIKGYARIDAFMDIRTGALSIIELNTLPGLTPSTVFYHQALAENPPIFPLPLLEKIIKNAGY